MPDATITSTASTFGTISGTFAADQSTITGTITGVVSGTLTGSVGVPGPQGPAGPGSTWGGIVGTLSAQTDLWTELGTKYLASNPAGYQTAAQVSTALSPYITSATATASFYPLTGNPSAFLQAAALSPYLLSSTASATYQTQAAMSAYLTTSAAAAGYYPLSGNPSGFLTAASLSGYATESWVTGQGYITSAALSPYLLSSTAASTYQTQSAMSAYLTKADNLASVASTSAARSNLGLGSLDTPTFAGITAQGSGANVANLTPTSLSLNHATSGSFTIQPSVGIVFPDGSTQTTAFTGSAPGYITSVSSPLSVSAGNLTIDLSPYALLSGATFSGSVFAPTPSPGTNSTRIATTEWVKDFDYAPTNSPHFTGNPQSVTPSTGDNDTSIATTAFVKAQNYITSAALSGYATESWVTTELGDYLTTASAASTYAALSGATDLGTYTWSVPMSSNSVQVNSTSISLNGSSSIYIGSTGSITFGDTTIQSTAYPGPSGFLLKANNLADLASASTARTNLGLGTMATATASDYSTTTVANGLYYPLISNPSGYLTSASLSGYATESWVTSALGSYLTTATAASTYQTQAGMSSYLTTSSAASTYAPLASPTFTGTVTIPAGASISGYATTASLSSYAPLASPALTGTPTAPTATTGTNTTQVATTAFVQQEVPAASTSAAGKVELATVGEGIVGTSTSLVSPLSIIPSLLAKGEHRSLVIMNYIQASGSGATSQSNVAAGYREMFLGSLSTGRACFSYGIVGTAGAQCAMSRADFNKIDFSKKVYMAGKAMCGATLFGTNYIGDSNTSCRVTLGGYSSATTGDMTLKGIGWKKAGGTSPYFTLTVHNGTTLTDVATTVQHAAGTVIDWVIYSDGTGNVTLYINGSEAATTSAGPTGTTNSAACAYREQVEAATTPGVRQVMHCIGGWLYIEG